MRLELCRVPVRIVPRDRAVRRGLARLEETAPLLSVTVTWSQARREGKLVGNLWPVVAETFTCTSSVSPACPMRSMLERGGTAELLCDAPRA